MIEFVQQILYFKFFAIGIYLILDYIAFNFSIVAFAFLCIQILILYSYLSLSHHFNILYEKQISSILYYSISETH